MFEAGRKSPFVAVHSNRVNLFPSAAYGAPMPAISRCTCQDFTDARRGIEHRIFVFHSPDFGFQLRTSQTVAFFCVPLDHTDPFVGTSRWHGRSQKLGYMSTVWRFSRLTSLSSQKLTRNLALLHLRYGIMPLVKSLTRQRANDRLNR